MSTEASDISAPLLSPRTREALLHAVVAVLIVVVSVSSFAVSTIFGVAATFAMTLCAAMLFPAGVPFLIACSFVFQNMVVAWYTPLIADNTTFDALRGANFVVLMTAFAVFFAAACQGRILARVPLRGWLLGGIGVGAVVGLYLAIGVVHGEAKDAIVYFRNILTPIACFYVAVIAASLYRVELERLIPWLAAFAIGYGYLELIFSMDFLSLFHGDQYIERDIWRQIQTGVWEKALHETGFVLRGLQDVMMTDAFNLPFLSGIFPKVFRVGGPTFHSISFAYALSIVSVWLLFNRRWVLPLAALPLLLIIGSKGAVALLIFGVFVRIAAPALGVRLSLTLMTAGAALWVAGSIAVGLRTGDYHTLGLIAGLRDFLDNPLGVGLGLGGNLSTDAVNINWEQSQAQGAAQVPMESAIGVMIYQMGIGALAYAAFLISVVRASWKAYRNTGEFGVLFLFVGVVGIAANAVLQEEAFFSPLALGFCLLLGGATLGRLWGARGRRPSAVAG